MSAPAPRPSFWGTAADGFTPTFWSVEPTGDFGKDARLGRALALEYLEHMKTGGYGGLTAIVDDMCATASKDDRWIRMGFLEVLQKMVDTWVHHHGVKSVREYVERADAFEIKMREEERAARSERARNAARARWAKARQEVAA